MPIVNFFSRIGYVKAIVSNKPVIRIENSQYMEGLCSRKEYVKGKNLKVSLAKKDELIRECKSVLHKETSVSLDDKKTSILVKRIQKIIGRKIPFSAISDHNYLKKEKLADYNYYKIVLENDNNGMTSVIIPFDQFEMALIAMKKSGIPEKQATKLIEDLDQYGIESAKDVMQIAREIKTK